MKKLLILTCVLFLSVLNVLAQDNLKVELKEDAKPDIYIDGKKYDHAILSLLDQTKIESMNVIKDAKTLKEYNAPNGVIIIKTKESTGATFKLEGKDGTVIVSNIKSVKADKSGKEPVVIIDGKVANKGALEKISPDNIESVSVFKGQQAIDKYNAPDGAIVVKTKQ